MFRIRQPNISLFVVDLAAAEMPPLGEVVPTAPLASRFGPSQLPRILRWGATQGDQTSWGRTTDKYNGSGAPPSPDC